MKSDKLTVADTNEETSNSNRADTRLKQCWRKYPSYALACGAQLKEDEALVDFDRILGGTLYQSLT